MSAIVHHKTISQMYDSMVMATQKLAEQNTANAALKAQMDAIKKENADMQEALNKSIREKDEQIKLLNNKHEANREKDVKNLEKLLNLLKLTKIDKLGKSDEDPDPSEVHHYPS